MKCLAFWFSSTPRSKNQVTYKNHRNSICGFCINAFLSEDDGETFPYSLLLDERKGVSYPDAQFCEDGFIRITYDRLRGCFKSSLEEVYSFPREILRGKITEADILAGRLVTEESELKKVICKLGKLDPADGDPFEK